MQTHSICIISSALISLLNQLYLNCPCFIISPCIYLINLPLCAVNNACAQSDLFKRLGPKIYVSSVIKQLKEKQQT